jgi:hypothetical protein
MQTAIEFFQRRAKDHIDCRRVDMSVQCRFTTPYPLPARRVYLSRRTILPPASSQPSGHRTKNSSANS